MMNVTVLCVDDPESVRVSRALSRLYDFNKPGNKDITSFPGRRHTRAHTLDDIEEEEEEQEVEEVYFGAATNHARYHQAKLEELQKWQEFNTYEEIPDTGQTRVSCKWVCTEKMKTGVLVTKARLVARGFEEDKSQLRTDSPTCYKDSLRILLSVIFKEMKLSGKSIWNRLRKQTQSISGNSYGPHMV